MQIDPSFHIQFCLLEHAQVTRQLRLEPQRRTTVTGGGTVVHPHGPAQGHAVGNGALLPTAGLQGLREKIHRDSMGKLHVERRTNAVAAC